MNRNKKTNYDKFVGLRMTSSLYIMLDTLAKTEDKKINNFIREALEEHVRRKLQI